MKKKYLLIGLLAAGVLSVQAQSCATDDCDCPSCTAKKEGTFSLPFLKGLDAHSVNDHAAHTEKTHSESTNDHKVAEAGRDEHAGHEHGAACTGHDDHEEGVGLDVTPETAERIGLQIKPAQGGTISKTVVFPAEILLNRDRAASVSSRYPSIIRKVFAEIGDDVRKGDVLASLENRETLAVYTVSAPLDGLVVSRDAAVGEAADEDRVLFEVADLSSVWADISVFPQYLHLIKKGMPVEFIAPDGHAARGTVKYISPLISHEARTFTARCILTGAREDFTPGAFVRARMVTESKQVPVRVEREAVQLVKGQPVIFIVDEHGYESRDVVTGLANDHFVEIKQGLAPGEHYVAAGAFSLKAEMVTSGMDPHAGHGH